MSTAVTIYVNGEALTTDASRSVAAALLAARGPRLRATDRTGEPRGMFCGMGICFDCLVTVDGRSGVRACMTPVREGMRIELS